LRSSLYEYKFKIGKQLRTLVGRK